MDEPRPVRPRTGPRYEPRFLLRVPDDFGRNPTPEFVERTQSNAAHLAGAQAQHVLAVRIRRALRLRDMTVTQLASATGLNYQRLTRVLRGSVLMRIEDEGLIARVVPEAFDYLLGTAENPLLTGDDARKWVAWQRHRAEIEVIKRENDEQFRKEAQEERRRQKESRPQRSNGSDGAPRPQTVDLPHVKGRSGHEPEQ